MKKSNIYRSILLISLFLNFLPAKNIAQIPSWLWAKSFGGSQPDYSRGTTIDNSGNIYTIGSFSDTIHFDSLIIVSQNEQNIFITKQSPQGKVLWVKEIAGNPSDHPLSITTDKDGNVFITGSFTNDSLVIGSSILQNTNPGSEDIFIGKLSADGNVQWLHKATGDGRDFPGDVKADADGNIVVTGFYESPSLSFDAFTLTRSAGIRSIYFTKYNTDGNVLWAKSFGGDWWDLGKSISFDNSGNIYLGGGFGSSSITFGSITLTKAPSNTFDLFIGKFTANGDATWVRGASGTGSEDANKTVVDENGNVYIASYSSSPELKLDGVTLLSNGDADALVAKYNSTGDIQWAKLIGGTGTELGEGIALDDSTYKIIISGRYNSASLSFGSKTLNNQGLNDIFLAQYDLLGNFIDAVNIGGPDDEINWGGMFGNEASGVVVTGTFESDTLKFASNTIVNHNPGTNDVFIARLFSPDSKCPDIPLNGLIAYYPFDSNLNDYSGNEHNGTAIGVVSFGSDRTGESNSSLNLGTGRVVTDQFFNFQRADSFSLSLWFTLSTSSSGGRLLSTECPEGNFRIAAFNDGVYAIQFGSSAVYIYDTVKLNAWNHIIYTYSNGIVKVYKNGVLKYSQINADTDPLNYCTPFTIGAKASPAYDLWQGSIDNLRMYNRSLNADEALQLYQECSGVLARNEIKVFAVQDGKAVRIKWIPESEEDIKSYVLQRSIDGIHFSDIELVTAKGYGGYSYNYLDNNVPANNHGMTFYRVKSNKRDGDFNYTETVQIILQASQEVSIYSNPAKDRVTVTYPSMPAKATAVIINSNGSVVKRVTLSAGSTQTSIDISGLSSGTYFFKIDNTQKRMGVKKFIKE